MAKKTAEKPHDLTAFILERNKIQSREFCSPGTELSRRMYLAKHPSRILAMKCMDGRLNLALMTETPPGIIQPFRNVGGKFDLGWPFFGHLLLEEIEEAVASGRPAVVLSTYHFSKGDTHRGCAGYQHDTKAAHDGARRLHDQFERVFGGEASVVRTLVVGVWGLTATNRERMQPR